MIHSIRTKLIFVAAASLILAIAANTLTSSYVFIKENSKVHKSRALVIGKILKSQLERLLRLGIPIENLVGFDKQCQDLVNKYKEISYAMVIDVNGKILFHNDPSQHDKILTDSKTLNALRSTKEVVQIDAGKGEEYYDIFIPVFGGHNEYVAKVRIGFPVRLIAQKAKTLFIYSLIVALVSLGLALILLVLPLSTRVTKPITKLLDVITGIRKNKACLSMRVEIDSKDEIGQLGSAFNHMLDDLEKSHKEITKYSEELELKVDERTARLKEVNEQLLWDIAERKRTEKELQESEEKFRSISASAMDAIIMINDEDNVILWNPAAEKIFGYTSEEINGKKLHSFIIPGNYHEAYKKGFSTFKTTGMGDFVGKTIELEAVRKDGAEFPVELSLSKVKREDQWNAIGIVRDITDRKLSAEKLEKAYAELVEKTESLERFHRITVGREMEMVGLKEEVNALLEELGRPKNYETPDKIKISSKSSMPHA